METDQARVRAIWNQKSVPVLLRRTGKGERQRLRLPYRPHNRVWLRGDRRSQPEWIKPGDYWEFPKSWFSGVVEQCLREFGRVYIIQPYREQEKCAPACWNAKGHECQCSCMGANHGVGGGDGWFEVSDTFASRWGPRMAACRLLTRQGDAP